MAAEADKKTAVAINPVQARTHALNVEGIFFQQRIANDVRHAGWWVTAEEYPVALPKGNGPILGKEGRLDIRAERMFTGYRTILAIECKKADQEFKEWVFFPKGSASVKATTVRPIKQKDAPDAAPEFAKWHIHSAIAAFATGIICNEARELKGEYGKRDSWKSSTERIEKACYQATQAAQAIYLEIIERQNGLLHASQPPDEIGSWIIPIVVTTANLFVCRFQPGDISLETGEIDWNRVNYEPDNVTVLEYPLPVHLQMPPAEPLKVGPADVETFAKKHVFIVKSTSLDSFLRQADLGIPMDKS